MTRYVFIWGSIYRGSSLAWLAQAVGKTMSKLRQSCHFCLHQNFIAMTAYRCYLASSLSWLVVCQEMLVACPAAVATTSPPSCDQPVKAAD